MASAKFLGLLCQILYPETASTGLLEAAVLVGLVAFAVPGFE